MAPAEQVWESAPAIACRGRVPALHEERCINGVIAHVDKVLMAVLFAEFPSHIRRPGRRASWGLARRVHQDHALIRIQCDTPL
jgi:hypothetical protein